MADDGRRNRGRRDVVSPAMTTSSALRPLVALTVAAAIGLAACAGSAAPSESPPQLASPSIPPGDLPTDSPAAGDPGAGGGSAGDPGSGVGVAPADPVPLDPLAGQPKLVQPLPGRLNPHPAVPTAIQASVDGRHVLVKVSWYGGVEPCSVLDSVTVVRSGNDIQVTPVEGASDGNAMCIELAVLKATIVDLGDLASGTWRISSPGSEVAPVVLTIT